jgi:UDP-glucose 4-epimerase
MKIFMTGGAGYVGGSCLRWLLRNGHDVVAYDNLSQGNRQAVSDGRLIVGDLLDRERLTRVLCDGDFDAVMHFAAVASVPDSIHDPDSYYDVNVLGTKNVLDAMRQAGVNRIVMSSTAATYSFSAEMPLRETAAQIPVVPYGSTKLAAEWLLKDYGRAYGIGHVIFRYFNASGADGDGQHGESRRSESHLIPLALAVPSGRLKQLLVYGDDYDTRDGSCVRDYVHVEDLAQAHELAIEAVRPGESRAYNLGTGNGATVLEVIRACEEVVGEPISRRVVARRPGDPGTLIACPDKAIAELGWQPRYKDVRDIIATAWSWHQSHPLGYPQLAPIGSSI